jgi:hypothetical protein
MEGLFQPAHLIFILIIVIILFGPVRLPEIGNGLRRAHLDWQGKRSNLRGALFMAKGVDPSVGRDVGDMLPDEDTKRISTWFVCLLSILIGNTLYFACYTILPPAAKMGADSKPGLPVLVDLFFCIVVFEALNLLALLRRRNKPKK